MFELLTDFRYFDVRDFVIRISDNSGIFYSGLCRIIKNSIFLSGHRENQNFKKRREKNKSHEHIGRSSCCISIYQK
jgi:hypothetical protein